MAVAVLGLLFGIADVPSFRDVFFQLRLFVIDSRVDDGDRDLVFDLRFEIPGGRGGNSAGYA
ncbi:MAG: hypothetical protein V1814_02200 [Candidatus Moraniibacteriota bacterium]